MRAAKRMAPLFLAWVALDWTIVNWICDLMGRTYPGRVLRIRFEDLCKEPEVELKRIGREFGLEPRDLERLGRLAIDREPLAVGHGISGNHLRHAAVVRFDPGGGKTDQALPQWLTAVITVLCGPLMRRYGYDMHRSPA